MTRTVYFAGSEPDCVTGDAPLSTTGVDTNYVRTGFQARYSQYARITLPAQTPDNASDGYWLHFRKYQATGGSLTGAAPVPLEVYNASGQLSLRVYVTASYGKTKVQIYANDGTYTESAQTDALYERYAAAGLKRLDFHVYTDANGDARVDVYVDEVLVLSVIDTSGYQRGMRYAQFKRPFDDAYCVYSEFIVANFDTRGLRVGTYLPAADGTYTDGIGTYSDIDELTPDAAVIALANVGDKQSYTLAKYGSPTLTGILALAVNGLVASDGTHDLQAGLRIDAVDYFSSDLEVGAAPTVTSAVWSAHPGDSGFLPQAPATDIEVIYQAVA